MHVLSTPGPARAKPSRNQAARPGAPEAVLDRVDAGAAEQERKRARTSRKDNAAAVKRYQARKSGVPVLRQRQGRQPIYLKPVCRVFQTCPLRPYCTVEAKGLA